MKCQCFQDKRMQNQRSLERMTNLCSISKSLSKPCQSIDTKESDSNILECVPLVCEDEDKSDFRVSIDALSRLFRVQPHNVG
mmetsp:Transcript_13136/g.18164  ORF Transcript_13136/g.18164 Transcript_13136/m.18164 type:complete len:82 (+) Transcript_13136:1179-1424(+)